MRRDPLFCRLTPFADPQFAGVDFTLCLAVLSARRASARQSVCKNGMRRP
jgi:hypothetical protein